MKKLIILLIITFSLAYSVQENKKKSVLDDYIGRHFGHLKLEDLTK